MILEYYITCYRGRHRSGAATACCQWAGNPVGARGLAALLARRRRSRSRGRAGRAPGGQRQTRRCRRGRGKMQKRKGMMTQIWGPWWQIRMIAFHVSLVSDIPCYSRSCLAIRTARPFRLDQFNMLYNMLYSKLYVLCAGAGSQNVWWKANGCIGKPPSW